MSRQRPKATDADASAALPPRPERRGFTRILMNTTTSETDSNDSIGNDDENNIVDDSQEAEQIGESGTQVLMDDEDESPSAIDSDGLVDLAKFARNAYLEYAMSVVTARALPDVSDGNKPVLRRVLWSMHKLGLTSTSKPVKSARVVGDVLGKYHPHGDRSVYDAAVRVSQDFTLRYPLIDGQGNFGSRDGDEAAAMRYTEMRLTPISEMILSEIEKDTVDFIPNYDGAFEEPRFLPSRLPMILLNGGSGIAVGMATEIPSHNLREVVAATLHLMKNPDATLDDVMQIIPAPDYPGGGQIIASAATIREAYATGRGTLRMRAMWKKEDLARGQWRLVVYEHAHGTSTAKVLEQIGEASNPQIKKGKKDLSQDQKNIKALILSVLDGARDEANKESPVRMVLEPKNSKITPEELIGTLYTLTSLECSAPVNMTMLGRDGSPQRKDLVTILKEWIDFRMEVVERRIKHRLVQVRNRLHILNGRKIAFIHMDEVIKIIRESEDSKEGLMSTFSLSEIQAEDILEIKLRSLARMEGIKIQEEIDNLSKEDGQLQHLLDDPKAFQKLVSKELEDDSKKYGDDRRTLVEPVETTDVTSNRTVPDEPVTVLLSVQGWARARHGHGIDRSTLSWKQGDSEGQVIETRSVHPLIVLDHKGMNYSIDVSDIPQGRGDGVPLTSLIQLVDGGKPVHVFSDEPSASYLFTNSGSYGFITQVQNLVTRRNAGKRFMTLDDGEEILAPVKVVDMDHWLVACSLGEKEARMTMFKLNEMKVMPKGRGVIVMGIDTEEKLSRVSILPVTSTPNGVSVKLVSGQKLTIKGDEIGRFMGKRARKGYQIGKKVKVDKVDLI